MNARRQFIVGLGSATLAMQFGARAQPKVPRLGVLLYNSPRIDPIAPLLQGLEALGYVDGKTIAIDYRFADGKPERLPDLAAELVQLKPDAIFAFGGDVAPFAKRATSTIPVIVSVSNDPVQSGLITSMSHPGQNITGMTQIYDELAGKVVELLKETSPQISRVAVLWNPAHADPEFRETQRAAKTLGIRVQSLEVRRSDDFAGAFAAALNEQAEALIIVSTRLLLQQRREIVEFGTRNRIIMAGNWSDWVKDGVLLTYGPNIAGMLQRLAIFIDKVLKGTPAADIPMERPERFELAINLSAAKALGVRFPDSIQARADTVVD